MSDDGIELAVGEQTLAARGTVAVLLFVRGNTVAEHQRKMATRASYMKILLVSTVAIATASLRAQPGPPACLHYEPDTVRVTGHLSRHMYYGAPGYGEDPRHDEREVGFYLDLPAPVCMAPGGDEIDVAKSGIRRIQLVLDENGYARLRPLLGKMVMLRGTLSGAINGHHHAPVLLTVIRPVRVER